MKNSIAYTLGLDTSEVSGYRYQDTRTTRAIYAIDDNYFAQGLRMPTDKVGGPWRKYGDQFWAQQFGTIIWVCDMITD
jgi:hypothetical protein